MEETYRREGVNRETPVVAQSSTGRQRKTSSSGRSRIEEDRELLRRYQVEGDEWARDQLLQRFMPLARQLARRYERANEPLDDLLQVASIGLVKAIDRFDHERGSAFSSYAVPTILGELKRYFRDSGWAVHVPRGMQERVMKVNQSIARLSRTTAGSPSPADIAADTGLSHEEVLEALEAAMAYDSVSLDTPRNGEEDEGDSYVDTLGDIDDRFELVEYEASIAPALQALPERDRLVLHLRFVEDLTQSDIAERVGVSQMHVSRLIRRALTKLRTVAETHEE
jgi:RNA polymerase sigma-B factor